MQKASLQHLFHAPLREQISVLRTTPKPHNVVRVPGSKSFTNRACVLAGMSSAPVILQNFLFSDDSWWALDCLERLEFEVDVSSDGEVRIVPPDRIAQEKIGLYFGNAGTLARFFPAVILNLGNHILLPENFVTHLEGSAQLQRRPLAELSAAFHTLGAKMSDKLPFVLSPALLKGETHISGRTSGQFLSGLLLAGAGAKEKIRIRRTENLVQPDYVRMTLNAVSKFGGQVESSGSLDEFVCTPVSSLNCEKFLIEADASTACYFLAFAALHNINLVVQNIGSTSLQPDLQFVDFLRRLGKDCVVNPHSVEVHTSQSPLLQGGFEMDFSAMSDQCLTAAALAVFADRAVSIRGIAHVRGHESDRISCLCANFKEIGLNAVEHGDGFTIHPAALRAGSGKWRTHGDHRFAMSGFLLASRLPRVSILNPDVVEKTCPQFFEMFADLGARYE